MRTGSSSFLLSLFSWLPGSMCTYSVCNGCYAKLHLLQRRWQVINTDEQVKWLFFPTHILMQETLCNGDGISVESTDKRFVVRSSSLHTVRWIHTKVQTSCLYLISIITPSPGKTPPLHFEHSLRLCTSDPSSCTEKWFIMELRDYIIWYKNLHSFYFRSVILLFTLSRIWRMR